MASCSDYFRSMFTGGMKEQQQSIIELKAVSSRGLEKLIEIIYTSHTHFDSYLDLFDVIAAANHLQCLVVIDYCEKNFLKRINLDNFNAFIQMAHLYGMKNAAKKIDLFIANNLVHIINKQSDLIQNR
jgi:kelch-like protein 9/13